MKLGDLYQNEYYVVIVVTPHEVSFSGCVLKVKKVFECNIKHFKTPKKGEISLFSTSDFKPLKRGTIIKP
jgi:subtilase family serine protease